MSISHAFLCVFAIAGMLQLQPPNRPRDESVDIPATRANVDRILSQMPGGAKQWIAPKARLSGIRVTPKKRGELKYSFFSVGLTTLDSFETTRDFYIEKIRATSPVYNSLVQRNDGAVLAFDGYMFTIFPEDKGTSINIGYLSSESALRKPPN